MQFALQEKALPEVARVMNNKRDDSKSMDAIYEEQVGLPHKPKRSAFSQNLLVEVIES